MREPLFTWANRPALEHQYPNEVAALQRAIALSIESAFRYGIDMPVGAVALYGSAIIGRGYAGDTRLGAKAMHAERMAVFDTLNDVIGSRPDTVVVTLEPCSSCQDFLATQPDLKRVAFGLSRTDTAERGLMRGHDEDIFQRAQRVGLPYEVIQIDDPALRAAGMAVLNNMTRDIDTGRVSIDRPNLTEALMALNEA